MRRSSTTVPNPRRSCAAFAPTSVPPMIAAMQPDKEADRSDTRMARANRRGIDGSSAGFECVAQPVRLAVRIADRDDVEPARLPRERRIRGEEQLRGAHELAAFRGSDRVDAIAETGRAPIAHLDEHDVRAIAHDQVQFAVSIGYVTCNQAQSGPLQVGEGDVLVAAA